MDNSVTGQHALRGAEEVSIVELLNMVEKSCGVEAGNTKARFETPVLPIAKMMEEFFIGMGADTNMAEMLAYFSENQDAPVTGADFWAATGSEPEVALRKFFESRRVSEEDETLLLPTFGGYKFNYAN